MNLKEIYFLIELSKHYRLNYMDVISYAEILEGNKMPHMMGKIKNRIRTLYKSL